MTVEALTIVLAEDDDGHATLILKNLERAGVTNGIVRVKDGQEALDYLYGEGQYAGSGTDGNVLLMLDVKMPKFDGVEVLRRVKADSRSSAVPVIMLTTTDDPREVERCYQLGCNVYITKPVDYDDFVNAMRQLGLFLQVVRVPRIGAGKGAKE